MPTNLFTSVTIDGTAYSIKKFDAKTGLKLARLVISKAAPIIPMLDKITGKDEGKNTGKDERNKPDAEGNKELYKVVGAVLETLSDSDLDDLMDKCLRVCYASLPAGEQPIIDENGNFGVPDVEYDIGLCIRLCFEAIKWGAADFFAGKSSLSSLLPK